MSRLSHADGRRPMLVEVELKPVIHLVPSIQRLIDLISRGKVGLVLLELGCSPPTRGLKDAEALPMFQVLSNSLTL